ncbi:DUF2625 domain-containing protein [Mucilaginibacter sp.]|uniref:DUF2625 domain-containing protein n=1 Tax=Mucilaginibacter sp. TaxID=1882438 RepID=UPI0025E0A194|nr:DUF2625 domain-containing protein [Mucilaginibacter sp.]
MKHPFKLSLFILSFFLLARINSSIAQSKMRPVEELTADTSGWGAFMHATKIARNKFEILPVNPAKANETLYQTQVTTHSIMGAIVYFSGGILIDDGWIRILGSGNEKLDRTLSEWNKGKTFKEFGEKPQFLLVADDVIGGFFAINGGALGPELGKVYYLAPDDLKWESLHIGYSEFIDFCLVGNMDQFYDKLRWKSWRADMTGITGNKGFSIYPFTWTVEGKDIEKDSRKVVPIEEIYRLETDALKQLPITK